MEIKLQPIYFIISGKNSFTQHSSVFRHSIDALHFRLKNETTIKDPYRGFISVNWAAADALSMSPNVSIYSRAKIQSKFDLNDNIPNEAIILFVKIFGNF